MVRPTHTADETTTTTMTPGSTSTEVASWVLPPLGDNPSTGAQGTTPGSFANKGRIGTAWTFSSPDTPGMPEPSEKTAWDFLPEGWSTQVVDDADCGCGTPTATSP